MSKKTDEAKAPVPKLNIAPASEPEEPEEAAAVPEASEDPGFDEAIGFMKGFGIASWKWASAHPNTAVGALAGFVLAVLILVIGLWSTIIIAVFVLVGALLGQIKDGDNSLVNFFSHLFEGRR